MRRIPDATEQCRLALAIDPLSMVLHVGMALCLFCAKQYREAIEYARRALEIDASFYFIWFVMGQAQLGAGFLREATTSLRRGMELAPWNFTGAGYLAAAYHQAGDRENGQDWARKVAASHSHHCGAAVYFAVTGEAGAMFEALEVVHQERDYFLLYIQYLPLFDPYRAEPRYQALLRSMNLA
jgi:serine/threonine-protein kinase